MITKRDKLGRIAKGSQLRHGMSDSAEYDCWIAMKARCYKEHHPEYFRYGGRGITVCERWLKSFDNFYSDMGNKPNGMTLDRKDVNGNYEPINCRWITHHAQQLNRRDNNLHPGISYEANRKAYNVRITVKGERINLGRYKSLDEAIAIRKQAEIDNDIY